MPQINHRATSLIRFRLRIDWLVWVYGFGLLILHFLYGVSFERPFFFGIVLLMLELAGASSYRQALRGGEGYHFMFRQTINSTSSFGLILACIIFDVFVLMIFSIYLISGLDVSFE